MSRWDNARNEWNPLRIVLSLVQPENWGNRILPNTEKRTEELLKSSYEYAKKNGLAYAYFKGLEKSDLGSFVVEKSDLEREERGIEEMRRTVCVLNEVSKTSGIGYVAIKMPYMIPHVPRDIDIFVPNNMRDAMIDSLKKHGMREEHSSSVETTLRGGGFSKIDIYSRICYFNFEFLDDTFFTRSRERHSLFGVECPRLNKSASLALEMLHGLFGHRSLTLLDFLNMKSLIEGMDNVKDSREIARKYGWLGVFDQVSEKLESIRNSIERGDEAVDFPLLFSREFVLECISSIEGVDLNTSQRALIEVSLLVDELILKSKGSGLYDGLKANSSIRRLVNSMAHSIRFVRGDRKVT